METLLGISEIEFEDMLKESEEEFYCKATKNTYGPDCVNKKAYERSIEVVKPNDREKVRD